MDPVPVGEDRLSPDMPAAGEIAIPKDYIIDNWTIDGILKQPFGAEAVRFTLPIEISMISLFIKLTTLFSTLINIDV